MEHECKYQDEMLRNSREHGTIIQKQEDIEKRQEGIDKKLDSLIASIEEYKTDKAKNSVIMTAVKAVAVFIISICSSLFINSQGH